MKKLNAQNMTWIDTRELAALRAENELLHKENERACEFGRDMVAECEKLFNEIARLTPRMVREVPTKAGNYHYIRDNGTTEIIKAIAYGGSRGTRYQVHGNDIEFTKSDFAGGLWSAEPIPMPVIEKEGER